MELRVLQYFLAVAREQNISAAAASLHLSQPTLSTQLKALEQELGKPLLIRGTPGSRKVTLTEEGMILRKRAEEILSLVQRTEQEIQVSDQNIAGDVLIGAGESDGVRCLFQAAGQIRRQYPDIRFHVLSGDGKDVMEELEKGLIDFGLLMQRIHDPRYETLEIPAREIWGVLMLKDSPLAQKQAITAQDLRDLPLILSRQAFSAELLSDWFGHQLTDLNIVGTYNLLYNGSLMVQEGLGYALGLEHIINTSGNSPLCFRPLSPQLEISVTLVWKKYQVFSRAAGKFLEEVRHRFANPNQQDRSGRIRSDRTSI